jgi:hypothetical protein
MKNSPFNKKMDSLQIEIAVSEQQLIDRIEMPLFFLVGGDDDDYLSSIVGAPIDDIIAAKTVDPLPENKPYLVYASRALLSTSGYARTFPLEDLVEDEWPILIDIVKPAEYVTTEGTLYKNLSKESPTTIEQTWMIRALRRSELDELAEYLLNKLKRKIYPEKIAKENAPRALSAGDLSHLYQKLSPEQRQYPLIILKDDLPVPLPITLGEAIFEIGTTGRLSSDQIEKDLLFESLKTSLYLLQI